MEAKSLAPTVPEQTAARVWVPESRKQTPVLAGLSRSQRRPPPGMPPAVQHLLVMAAGPPGTWGDILGGTLKPVMRRSLEAEWRSWVGSASPRPPVCLAPTVFLSVTLWRRLLGSPKPAGNPQLAGSLPTSVPITRRREQSPLCLGVGNPPQTPADGRVGGVRLRVEVCVREHVCAGTDVCRVHCRLPGSHQEAALPRPLSLPRVPHLAGACQGWGVQID